MFAVGAAGIAVAIDCVAAVVNVFSAIAADPSCSEAESEAFEVPVDDSGTGTLVGACAGVVMPFGCTCVTLLEAAVSCACACAGPEGG